MVPVSAHAGILSDFTDKVRAVFFGSPENIIAESASSQTMAIFKPVVVDEDEEIDSAEDSASSSALSATTGALRMSTEDIDFPTTDTISVYEVKKGDSIAMVAKLFGVSKNTIMWANDLKSEKLSPGDILVILPITGVKHAVKKGDTVASIAKKYKGDVDDIAKYNGIPTDAKLAIGDVVIVPEGEVAVAPTKIVKKAGTSKVLDSYSNSTPSGFFVRPIAGGRRTQGIHGHNGVDIAASIGTPIVAAAGGQVISAKSSGYNGGYGKMVIISHAGNVQTVYGHLNSVNVSVGQTVSQGQTIGSVGNTGKSTGPHLHFEVRGAKNPF
jgi:murein DD-endopeptidase MepM/ murein hydrolase activator NlpD